MKIYPPYSDGVSKLEGKSKTSLYSQLQSRVLRGGPSSVISFGFVFHFSRLSVAFLYSSSSHNIRKGDVIIIMIKIGALMEAYCNEI